MKKLLVSCVLCIASVVFSQDIKGVYLHTQLDTSSVFSMSVTLFTDASQNISRPSVQVFLGFNVFPSDVTFPLANTVNVNNVSSPTFTYSRNMANLGRIIYTDSFWIAGIRNFSVPDRSKIIVQEDVGYPSPKVDKGPEVTNFPLSLSNFTISGNQVTYNPSCYDADGDSLSYDFAPLSGTSYYVPVNAAINPTSGLFSFSKDSTDLGLYAFSIYITEWRKTNGTYGQVGLSNISFVVTTNPTVGVKEFSNTAFSFGLYPNPTSSYIVVDNKELLNQDLRYAIYDLQGKKLGEGTLNTNTQKSIDVSFLKQGVYFLNVSNGTKTFSNKFVKTEN